MTRIVAHVSTGQDGQRPTIRGVSRLSGQVRTASVASTSRPTWVLSRWEVLAFGLQDGFDVTRVQAGRAATVSMTVLALEAAWGRAEWNYNAVGMHCSASDAQCTEWPDDERDTRLRAYADLAEAARDFWRVLKRNASAAEWALILEGDLMGWAGLWRRGDWSASSQTVAGLNSILRGVVSDLRAAGVASDLIDVREMPAGTDISRAAATRGGSSSSSSSTSSTTTPRRKRGLGGVLLAAAALAVAVSVSKGR